MVTGLRGVLRTSGNEYPSIIGLYGTESDRDIEVYVQHFSLLPLMVNVVECNYLLIKFEEVDLVRHYCFYLLLVLTVHHSDTCLGEVVCHR